MSTLPLSQTAGDDAVFALPVTLVLAREASSRVGVGVEAGRLTQTAKRERGWRCPRVARAGVQRCVYTASEILPGKRCTSPDGSGRQSFQSKTLQPTTFGLARGARQGRQHGLHTPPAPPLPQVGLSRARGIKDAAEPGSRL